MEIPVTKDFLLRVADHYDAHPTQFDISLLHPRDTTITLDESDAFELYLAVFHSAVRIHHQKLINEKIKKERAWRGGGVGRDSANQGTSTEITPKAAASCEASESAIMLRGTTTDTAEAAIGFRVTSIKSSNSSGSSGIGASGSSGSDGEGEDKRLKIEKEEEETVTGAVGGEVPNKIEEYYDYEYEIDPGYDEHFPQITKQNDSAMEAEWLRYERERGFKPTMAQNIKCSQLRMSFSKLDADVVEDVFRQVGLDFEKALECLKTIYPEMYEEKKVKALEPVAVTKIQNQHGQQQHCIYDPDIVANLTEGRQEFQDAAAYWRNVAEEKENAWKTAKEIAHNQKSIPAVYPIYVQQAAKYKYELDNALEHCWYYTMLGLNAGNKNPNKIDLHGLGVSKAREICSKFLQNRKYWASMHIPKTDTLFVTVITGSGRHSVNNVPRLCPAIRQLLLQQHYEFSEPETSGSFVIRIRNADAPKRAPRNQKFK